MVDACDFSSQDFRNNQNLIWYEPGNARDSPRVLLLLLLQTPTSLHTHEKSSSESHLWIVCEKPQMAVDLFWVWSQWRHQTWSTNGTMLPNNTNMNSVRGFYKEKWGGKMWLCIWQCQGVSSLCSCFLALLKVSDYNAGKKGRGWRLTYNTTSFKFRKWGRKKENKEGSSGSIYNNDKWTERDKEKEPWTILKASIRTKEYNPRLQAHTYTCTYTHTYSFSVWMIRFNYI